MKTQFLFPHAVKKWGWVIIIPSLVLGVLFMFTKFSSSLNEEIYWQYFIGEYIDEFALVGMLSGLLLLGFSELQLEDEYTWQIRIDSLLWATYVNVGLIILSTIFLYDDAYFEAMTYNLFTLPLFFVIRFHLYLARR